MQQVRSFLQELGLIAKLIIRPAAGSVRENSGLAVLSVILAFGLWIFVTDAENPERTRRLGEPIPIVAVNVPPDVATPHNLGAVAVSVRAEENVLDSLTKDDFRATVDLTGLSVGDWRVLVEVEPLTAQGNLRVVDIITSDTVDSEDQIQVRLEQLRSKSVPVELEIVGTAPQGYALGTAEVGVTDGVVSGAQDEVGAVVSAVAVVDVEGRTESFEGSVRLEARNQQGDLVQGPDIDPRTVDVSIEIEQRIFSRALAVTPAIEGVPRQGYNVIGATVDPIIVTVFASPTFIDVATTVSTQPVDIGDATGDVVRTVSLDLPADVEVRGSVSVTVTVTIRPASGQQVFAVPIRVDGLEDNLSVVGSLPPAQVFLFGELPVLLELNPNDLTARVEVGGKGAGAHKVKVEVSAPDGLEVRSVSPQEIDIQLEQR